ncbi:MAG: hypothetical protein OEZ68_18855 [Gammaproteobacteria bacterium]|nr:hypothetical protein [Gammaproteobacteria bacterium]MDH5802867.1 hypothetical protein [Gammaproteobacteria bacterium]
MKSKLIDVPVLKAMPCSIEASNYNRVRLALCRLGNPLRLELINLRGLDVQLDNEAWVCVDRTLNDMPIFAWVNLQSRGRVSLCAPVPCQLRFYHNHADLICGTVLDLIDRQLQIRLSQPQSRLGQVKKFPLVAPDS